MPKLRPPKQQEEQPKSVPVLTAGEEPELFESEAPEIVEEKPVVTAKEPLKEEPKEENSLLKQVEAQKKSEALQRQLEQSNRERDEAIRRAQARDVDVAKFQKEAGQSRIDSIAATIAAATAEIMAAKKDIKDAISIGDVDAQTEAYGRLAEAQNSLSTAKVGQAALEESVKTVTEAPKTDPITDPVEAHIQSLRISDISRNWFRSHREYLTDARKNAKLNASHFDAIDEGFQPDTPEYVSFIETKLGLKEPPKVEKQDDEDEESTQTQQRASTVSAPVSREVPTGNTNQTRSGAVKLTPEQREYARISGVTEAEYAKQLQLINKLKANGQIGQNQQR